MGIESRSSTIEFNQRQDLQKEEKSRYEVERETRLKGPPIEIRYPSFSLPPLFVIYGDYGYPPRGKRGGAENDIFRNGGGISKGGIRDRNWPTASCRDSHDLFSIVVATSATDPRFDLETFVDEKTYFPTIDRSRICIYISRFEVNFMLLFNYEIRIITDRTGGCKRGRTRRRLSLPASFSNTFHP